MPRGPRRSQSQILQDQMDKLNQKIASLEEQLKKSKAEKKSIEQALKKTELDDLLELIDEKNISVQEIRKMLES